MVNSVLSSSLPTLLNKPADWQDFVNAYVQANTEALGWVNNVLARLLSVPDDVRGYNNIIVQILADANNQATILIQNPNNAMALSLLKNDLNGLLSQLSLVTTFISGAVASINSFKNQLPDMAAQLTIIATKSAADSNADQAQIKELQDAIDSLNTEIKSLTADIVGLAIADAAALTLGTIATVAAWPVGAATWLVFGPVVAVATTFIVLDGIKISEDKALINQKTGVMNSLTADVSTLNTLSKSYSEMSQQADLIETNLSAILAEWSILESEVNQAVTDINTAIADANTADFVEVQAEIADAMNAWNEAYTQAGALHLELAVNPASLAIGMSSEDVQNAMAKTDSVDIIQYFNQIGVAA
jgi:phage host-nuclease inhibitor protein Gam